MPAAPVCAGVGEVHEQAIDGRAWPCGPCTAQSKEGRPPGPPHPALGPCRGLLGTCPAPSPPLRATHPTIQPHGPCDMAFFCHCQQPHYHIAATHPRRHTPTRGTSTPCRRVPPVAVASASGVITSVLWRAWPTAALVVPTAAGSTAAGLAGDPSGSACPLAGACFAAGGVRSSKPAGRGSLAGLTGSVTNCGRVCFRGQVQAVAISGPAAGHGRQCRWTRHAHGPMQMPTCAARKGGHKQFQPSNTPQTTSRCTGGLATARPCAQPPHLIAAALLLLGLPSWRHLASAVGRPRCHNLHEAVCRRQAALQPRQPCLKRLRAEPHAKSSSRTCLLVNLGLLTCALSPAGGASCSGMRSAT